MNINQNRRRNDSSLAMLEFVARQLGSCKDKFIFLGGCATALLVDDPVVPEIRSTLDVDCIVDVISVSHYHQLEEELKKLGFKQSIHDEIICRWHHDEIILDVMPTDERILGFSNRWYKSAIKQATIYELSKNLSIKMITAPYFLATKIEAFKTRGNSDFFASHDFEDIITVIDGHLDLLDEITLSDSVLKQYLSNFFSQLLKNKEFYAALPGHLNYGNLTDARTEMILARIEKIQNLIKNEQSCEICLADRYPY